MPTDSLTLAAGWMPTLTGLGMDVKDLIFLVFIPTLCGAFVVLVGWKSRAPLPTIMAVLLAGIVWGLSMEMEGLAGKTGETVNEYEGNVTVPVQGDQ